MNRSKIFVSSILLLLTCLFTVGQLLLSEQIPQTPNQDLARHIAAIENFRLALADGQWIPRWQLPPPQVPDLPLFQFYGFMGGLLSQPFLELGFNPLSSLMLAVVLARWIGAVSIFHIGRMLNANTWCCLLASISYLLTPYIISNLYGRVAVPEAIAHGFLPLLLYGFVRFATREDMLSVGSICAAVVALSLSHAIFFLYGVLAAGVFLVLTARRQTLFVGGLVLLAAVLIGSFQWVPGFQLRESFIGNFTINSPYERASLTSFSGLYGMPSALIEDGQESASQLYLTPGILTIPIFILLSMRVRREDHIAIATLACLAIFAVISMAAFDFWQFMPRFLWAVQFPYRLVAFVALFTAIGICVTLKSLKPTLFSLLICLLVAQNWKLLWEPAYSIPLEVRQEEVGLYYPIVDYMIRPPEAIAAGDGWLIFDNRIFLKADVPRPSYFSIRGTTIFADGPLELWLARPSDHTIPLTGKVSVGPGSFNVRIGLPDDLGEYTLVSSRHLIPAALDSRSPDTRRLSISVLAYSQLSEDGKHVGEQGWQIPANDVSRVRSGGYKREFRVRSNSDAESGLPIWVELPIAYSPLTQIRQHGLSLPVKPTDTGRAAVQSTDIRAPFAARFRVPVLAWLGSLLGLAVFGVAVVILSFRKAKPQTQPTLHH